MIAQLVERIHGKDEVPGSTPGRGSKLNCKFKKINFMNSNKSINKKQIFPTMTVDYGNWIYGFLSFLFPPVGIILYVLWSKSRKNTSMQIATGLLAFVSVIILYAVSPISTYFKTNLDSIGLILLICFVYLLTKRVKKIDIVINSYINKSTKYSKENNLQIVNISFIPRKRKAYMLGSMISFVVAEIFTAIILIISSVADVFFSIVCGILSVEISPSCRILDTFLEHLVYFTPLIFIPFIIGIIFVVKYFVDKKITANTKI